MRCLILDDDPLYNDTVTEVVVQRFPSLKDKVELISTEKAFRERLQSPRDLNVDFIIMDVMVHWADPWEDELPDPDLVPGGYFKAGIRCFIELRKHKETAKIPIIIHSAVDRDTVRDALNVALEEHGLPPEEVTILEKTGNKPELLAAIENQITIAKRR